MEYSDDIFQLVKSLTKQEKSYFKKFATVFTDEESSNYLKYFDEIVNQISKDTEYDEEKIRTMNFSGKFLKNLSYHMNYLYSMILSSLTLYHRNKKNYFSLSDQISQISLLLEKSLFEQAKKIIIKAKKNAYDAESFLDLIKILNLEKKIINLTPGLDEFVKKNKATSDEMFYALDIIQNNNEFHILYNKLGAMNRQSDTGFARKEEVSKLFENLNNSELMKDEANAKSFHSRFMYKNIKMNYYLNLNDYESANKYSEEIVNLMEVNLGKGDGYMYKYLISLNNLLTTQIRTKKFDASEKTVVKMREAELKFSGIITTREKVFLFYSISVLMISKYIESCKFDKLKSFNTEVLKDFDKYEFKITLQQRIILYYFLGLSNFINSDFTGCIKWMGKIINSEKSTFSEDYQSHSRILYLLSYYELKYFDSLEYILKSTYHFLSKRKRVYKFENIILKYLRKSFRIKTEKELYKMFDEMKFDLKKIVNDPFEKNAFDTFNILYWLESKLKKIPVTDVIINEHAKEAVWHLSS